MASQCLPGRRSSTLMIKGTIVIIQIDKSKGNEASNSDPLHVFDMETSDKIYSFLENEGISPEGQK